MNRAASKQLQKENDEINWKKMRIFNAFLTIILSWQRPSCNGQIVSVLSPENVRCKDTEYFDTSGCVSCKRIIAFPKINCLPYAYPIYNLFTFTNTFLLRVLRTVFNALNATSNPNLYLIFPQRTSVGIHWVANVNHRI